MTDENTQDISVALEALVESFRTLDGVSRVAINTGLCADFADAFTSSYGNGTDMMDLETMVEEVGEGRMPGAVPPPGLTWELLGEMGMTEQLSHSWVIFEGRHYDAESTAGVDNPFDLLCVRHGLHELMVLRQPDLLAKLTEEHPWWQKTLDVRKQREPEIEAMWNRPVPA